MHLSKNIYFLAQSALRRMLFSCNTTGVYTAVFALLGAFAVAAQEAEADAPADAPELGWADGEAAFGWVEGWVRGEAGVPADADLPGQSVTRLFGVSVTLRDQGRVLGRGEAYRKDVADTVDRPGKPVKMAGLLAAATRKALDELRDKQMKRAVELGIKDPKLFEQALLDTRKRVQVDLQLGHSLSSIVLPLNAPDNAVFTQYAPGYHGLRLSGPIAADASYAWPATELSRNTTPPRMVFTLLQDQGFDAQDLALVARGDGPALQRFKILHIVRTGAGQPVHQLTRGNLMLNQQVIDGRTIAGLAERVARYLDRLIYDNPRTGAPMARGTYLPSAQRYAPASSDPLETSLLCYATTRHAQVAIAANLTPEDMRERSKRALRLALRLAPDALPNEQEAAPKHLTAAFVLLTLCETPVKLLPDQLVLRDRIGQTLLALKHPEGGGFRVALDNDQRLSRESAAVVTAALAAWHRQTRSKSLAEPVWSVLDQLLQANAKDPRAIDMFWISLSLDMSGQALAAAQPDPQAAAKKLEAWRAQQAEYLERLSDLQIRTTPVLGPNDVLGGFVYQEALPGTPPNPTWRSSLAVGVLAFALREPDIVPIEQAFGPILNAQLGARFLGQLIVTPASTFYMRDPQPAMGGVRNTLWDNTLSPVNASMVLLALAEMQQSLNELEVQSNN